MIILAPSKEQVQEIIGGTDDYLRGGFQLQLNNKTAVLPAEHGCEFIGKVVTADKIHLRKDSSLRMKRHLAYVREAYRVGDVPLEYALAVMQSYLGLLKHTSDEALRNKRCEDYVLVKESAPD